MVKKKLFLLLLILLLCLSVTGCWSRKELKNLGIIGMIAIDKEDDIYSVILEIINPKRVESTSEINEVTYIKGSGKSISKAVNNAASMYEKRIYPSHVNAYVISEAVAKEGITKSLESYNRYYESRRYVHLAVVKELDVGEIVEIGQKMSQPSSQYIEQLYENYTNNGKSISVKIIHFFKNYYEEGIEPVTGVLEKSNNISKEIPYKTEGLAIFKDEKLVGYFDGEQTRSYNLVTGLFVKGFFETSLNDYESISVNVLNASSSLFVIKRNNKYIGEVEIDLGCVLAEVIGDKDFTKNNDVEKIEESFSIKISNEINEAIQEAQDYESDIFGFGQYIHRKYPKEWHNIKAQWNDIFAAMEVEVTVEVDIEKAGLTNEQLSIKER